MHQIWYFERQNVYTLMKQQDTNNKPNEIFSLPEKNFMLAHKFMMY